MHGKVIAIDPVFSHEIFFQRIQIFLTINADLENAPRIAHDSDVPENKSNDPLHGITLEALLTELVAHYGWRELARRVEIRCFMFDPSIKSSLTFLRKNPWARTKVEEIFIGMRSSG